MLELKIVDNKVIVREYIKERVVSLDSFTKALVKDQEVETPLLPTNTIKYKRSGTTQTVIVEEFPKERHVKVRDGSGSESDMRYTIKTNFIYYKVIFNINIVSGLYIYAANNRITNEHDHVCHVGVPNIYGNFNVCVGSMSRIEVGTDIRQATNDIINSFWGSSFNNDLLDHTRTPSNIQYSGQGVQYLFEKWEQVDTIEHRSSSKKFMDFVL